jgi:hypothetical protein
LLNTNRESYVYDGKIIVLICVNGYYWDIGREGSVGYEWSA